MSRTARAAAFAAFLAVSSTAFAQLPPGAGADRPSTRSAAVELRERTELTAALVNKWKAYVQEAHHQDGDQWAGDIARQASYASIDALRQAARAADFDVMNNTLRQVGIPSATLADIEALTTAGRLGDVDQDLVYVPVTPCRIIDTRVAGGVIAANTVRAFDVTSISDYSGQGGAASNCNGVGAAGSFAAAIINFTVVTPSTAGYITAYPYLGTQPLASTLNYAAGDVVGNLAVVKLDQGASANELNVYSFAQTHLVADIVGYFRNPAIEPLQCVNSGETIDTVAAGQTQNTVAPACPATYVQTGTNCETSSWQMPLVYASDGTCSGQNNSASSAQLRASRTCCRLPQ